MEELEDKEEEKSIRHCCCRPVAVVCHSRNMAIESVHLIVDKKQERSERVRGSDIPAKGITLNDLTSLHQAPLPPEFTSNSIRIQAPSHQHMSL